MSDRRRGREEDRGRKGKVGNGRVGEKQREERRERR